MKTKVTEIPLWNRVMTLTRPGGDDPAPSVAGLVQSCAAFSERTVFRYRIGGRSPKPFNGALVEIEGMFDESRRAMERGRDLPVVLATDRQVPFLTLSFAQDPLSPKQPHHKVEISFDLSRPLVGPRGHFTFDELIAFFTVCISGFRPATGSIYDSQLLEIVVSTMTREAMIRQLPPKEHSYIPVSPVVEAVPRELVERLARLRHPTTFDITHIPEAVFWINYWGPKQLVAVGEARIRAAPWAFIAPHPSGGLLLASQRDAFDALNTNHLSQLALIADAIDLHSIQGNHHKRK